MLQFLDIKMNEFKPGFNEVILKFHGNDVNKDKYLFLRDKLDDLKLYIDDDIEIKLASQYNEFNEQMLIEVTILTPDHLMPEDFNTAIKVFMNYLSTIQNFYEAQSLIFDKSHQKASSC
jgi:hypothetical protein